ncbi:MAG: indole-3-glycerol-phosphate synthase [Methanothrix sp.]|uniref:indole-3-glycerol-phosphate synthase n=1 Tax=Methanothrix sp. TaxID=90426 RepID=UPI0025D74609|nr:indole-3-glycerol-phosphate synthase [Methanothrix sp.]MCQ8903666.1 indole-3-glycerol-phosphate synthase [Methanothrix sp.]
MHPLIEGILSATELRMAGVKQSFDSLESRDLIGSAISAREKGLIPVIAEIKPRAISRPMRAGEAGEMARFYESMGACGISVLTEPTYFLGSISSLEEARTSTTIPVLRKDFIINRKQIREAEADLVLLIASIADIEDLIEDVRAAGMEPLVEVHDEDELDRAADSGALIVGINNRDLRTLEVDLRRFEALGPIARDLGLFTVAESGVGSREDAMRMMRAGADAILIGTSIMKNPALLGEITGIDMLAGRR